MPKLIPSLVMILMVAIFAIPECGYGQTRTVHIADSLGNVGFRAHLNAAFSGLKVPLKVVSDPSEADYVLQSFVVSREGRKRKWHEGVLTPQQETAAAEVVMLDRCGAIAWSETAGDLPTLEAAAVFDASGGSFEPGPHQTQVRVSMDALVGRLAKGGPKKVANRIARRLRTSVRKGEVRVSPKSCPEE